MGGSLVRIAASRSKHASVDMRDRVRNVPPQLAHLSRGVMRDVRAGEPDPSAGRLFQLENGAPNGFTAPGFARQGRLRTTWVVH